MFESAALTREEAVRRAIGLAPAIAALTSRAESERRIPMESVEAFVGAGLARILQPKRWGGWEISHDAAFDVTVEISKACGSTGWCLGFLNIHDWWLASFPEEAQHDVWRDGPDVNLAGVIAPFSGRAKKTDGGWRLDGKWSWASGIDHCAWVIVTALVDDGLIENARVFLAPRRDFSIADTWFNAGLRATGSKDVAIEDAFVPEHRTISMSDLREGTAPGSRLNRGPLYGLPLDSRRHALSGPALGAARGALAHWRDWMRTKTSAATGAASVDSAPSQIRLAQAEAEIDAAEMLLRRNLDAIRGGGPLSQDERTLSASTGAYAVHMLTRAIDMILQSAGSRALFDHSPIQRAWRDVHAIASHVSLNPDTTAQARARFLLGLPATA
jgi:3-hydroxy-9,10-secoandrosta-1,3,5(10)-triene-9,17-dione monooxygenase